MTPYKPSRPASRQKKLIILSKNTFILFRRKLAKTSLHPLRLRLSKVITSCCRYVYKNDSYKPLTLYENNVLPAVSVIATPEDMGRFIIAHTEEARKQANLLFETTYKPIYDT